jgi:hypothetical protein
MADIAGFFKKTLPSMAAAVASGIPGPIGAVAQIISAKLGKDVKPDADSISAAIAGATPDQILKLKEDDQQFQSTMQKLGFDHDEDMEKLAVDDRVSARDREKSVRDYTPEIGFYLLASIFAFFLHWLFKYPIPIDNKAIIFSAMGSLTTILITAATYFYGTTRGSEQKNQLLANSMPIKK